ncbi:MAG: ROK family protein [Acidobacteriota bacterium]|nr:ROK family protein [Acidobacteriota bacterium]
MRDVIVGIDVGGTKVAGGLVTTKGRLHDPMVVPTKAKDGVKTSFLQVKKVIERLIHRAGGKQNVIGIGLCAPGALDTETGLVINAPNLPGWERLRLACEVERAFGLPSRVENDANLAGLAEVLFGAAKGYKNVFYVTVSTGIGTGIIIDRKIYHGHKGVAGEGGHVSIDYRSPYRCTCGTLGCIEVLASGPAMARRARVRLEQEHAAPSLLRDLTRGQLRLIAPEMIAAAAARGDAIAKEILDETGFLLGVWLGGMISLLDPAAIVIGGGVARIGKPLFSKMKETVLHYTINPPMAAKIPILPAKLQQNVGVYGAASLFLSNGVGAGGK